MRRSRRAVLRSAADADNYTKFWSSACEREEPRFEKRAREEMFYKPGWDRMLGRGRRFKRRSCLSRSDRGDAIRARLPVIGPHQNSSPSPIQNTYHIIPPSINPYPALPPVDAANRGGGRTPTATTTACLSAPAMAIDQPRTRIVPSRIQESNPRPTAGTEYKALLLVRRPPILISSQGPCPQISADAHHPRHSMAASDTPHMFNSPPQLLQIQGVPGPDPLLSP